jgi:hypothetical protein
MNNAVSAEKCKCRKFTAEEFLVGLGLIIGASEFSLKGVDLFGVKDQIDLDDDVLWHSISASPHFEHRFKDFQQPYLRIQQKLRLIHGISSQRPLTTSMKFVG